MKKIFIKFLKLNNCYEQFIFNFYEQKDFHKCNSLVEFLQKHRDYV
jgi:hypothetical protein